MQQRLTLESPVNSVLSGCVILSQGLYTSACPSLNLGVGGGRSWIANFDLLVMSYPPRLGLGRDQGFCLITEGVHLEMQRDRVSSSWRRGAGFLQLQTHYHPPLVPLILPVLVRQRLHNCNSQRQPRKQTSSELAELQNRSLLLGAPPPSVYLRALSRVPPFSPRWAGLQEPLGRLGSRCESESKA